MGELILILLEMKDMDVARFGVKTENIPALQVNERRGDVKICNEQLHRFLNVCPTLPIIN